MHKKERMAVAKEVFRLLIREGQETIRDVELYDRPFEFEDHGRLSGPGSFWLRGINLRNSCTLILTTSVCWR